MGIKGLWTSLKNDAESNPSVCAILEEEIHMNDTLLIDATSFFFKTVELYSLKNYKNNKFHLLSTSLGSYNLLKNVLRNEILNLLSLNLNLIFYFDGYTDTVFKEFTKLKREQSRNEKWGNLSTYFSKNDYELADSLATSSSSDNIEIQDEDKVSSSKFPLPPLWKSEFITLLNHLKIPIKYCQFEADQEMAVDCFNFNFYQISYVKISHVLAELNKKKYNDEYLIQLDENESSESKKYNILHSIKADQLYINEFYKNLTINPYSLSHEETHHYPHRDTFYCYSEDTDFLLMKQIPLIKMNGLINLYEKKLIMKDLKDNDEENFEDEKKNINQFLEGNKKKEKKKLEKELSSINFEDDSSVITSSPISKTYKTFVWRRKKIAAFYNITERQLVEICLIVGNDYTSSFPLEKIFFSEIKLKRKFSDVLKFYLKNPGFSISTMNHILEEYNNELLNNSLDFSYQFYELKDIHHFLIKYTFFPDNELSNDSTIPKIDFKKTPSTLFENLIFPSYARKYIRQWFHQNFFVENLGYINKEDLSKYGVDPYYYSKININDEEKIKEKNKFLINYKKRELVNLLDLNNVQVLLEKFVTIHLDATELPLINSDEDIQFNNPFTILNKQYLDIFKESKKSIQLKKEIKLKSFHNHPKIWDYLRIFFFYQLAYKEFFNIISKKNLLLKLIIKNEDYILKNSPDLSTATSLFNDSILLHIKKVFQSNEKKTHCLLPSIIFNSVYAMQAILEIEINNASISKSIESPQEIEEEETPKEEDPNLNQRNEVLPIDQYREVILKRIEEDRVTIIHGETGCGKSSRIPLFLLDEAEKNKKKIKIIITQPRRIAVINLKNRLTAILKTKVGMRMGHGIKEESYDTKILFVTTGYLVRLMAHNPGSLANVTHLIIDEVHERSIDSDLICWLAKRSLHLHNNLRLVLMSATIHSNMYRDYFAGCSGLNLELPENCSEDRKKGIPQCLSVGVKRFKVDIFYIEDILALISGKMRKELRTPENEDVIRKISNLGSHKNFYAMNDIIDALRNIPTAVDVKKTFLKSQYDLAYSIITTMASLGSSVLVFVAGIADIEEIQLKFEENPTYRVIGIHTDIPFEEQQEALKPAEFNEVKVIVATNAAESSVTLPNMDLVLCLGTHKSMVFSPSNAGRSELISSWISKSSATQRAGRTGRIRPGTVIRLYTKELYESFSDFNEAEITSKPLHDVVLSLKVIFSTDNNKDVSVTNILQELVEPPSMNSLIKAFQYLYEHDMISSPTDDGNITSLGSLAGHLPIGVLLSKLVAYGVSLGVGVEAGVLAMALSQNKSLFRVPHSIAHNNPDQFNSIAYQNFFGSLFFYNNLYSDSLVYLKIFFIFKFFYLNHVDTQKVYEWCSQYNIIYSRIKLFFSTTRNFLLKLKELLGNPDNFNDNFYIIPAQFMPKIKNYQFNDTNFKPNESVRMYKKVEDVTNINPIILNRLRLIILWTLYSNLLSTQDSRDANTSLSIQIPAKIINDHVTKYFYGLKRSINFSVSYNLPGLSTQNPNSILFSILKICFNDTKYDKKGGSSNSSTQLFSVGYYSTTILDTKNISRQVTKKKNKTLTDIFLIFSTKNVAETVRSNLLKTAENLLKAVDYEPIELRKMFQGVDDPTLIKNLDNFYKVYVFMDIDRTTLTKLAKNISSLPSFTLNCNESNDSTALNLYGIEWSEDDIFSLYSNMYLTPKLKANIQKSMDKATKTSNGLVFSDGVNEEQFDFNLDIFGAPINSNVYVSNYEKDKTNRSLSSPFFDITNTLRVLHQNEKLPKPFFTDLPLGLRLYNSYALSQRKGAMKLFKPQGSKNNVESNDSKKLIPGTKEWYLAKSAQSQEEEYYDDNLFGGTIETLTQDPFCSTWNIINISDSAYKSSLVDSDDYYNVRDLSSYSSSPAILSRTFLAFSRYLPDYEQLEQDNKKIETETTLYAVCNNVLMSKKFICEGVTIFPPGDEWISTALYCLGIKLKRNTELYLDTKSCKYGNNSIVCEYITEMLSGLKSNYIFDQPKLYKTIDELFSAYNELYDA